MAYVEAVQRVWWCARLTMLRLLQMIGLFCKRALQKRRCPAKETHDASSTLRAHHTEAFTQMGLCGVRDICMWSSWLIHMCIHTCTFTHMGVRFNLVVVFGDKHPNLYVYMYIYTRVQYSHRSVSNLCEYCTRAEYSLFYRAVLQKRPMLSTHICIHMYNIHTDLWCACCLI